MLSRVAENVYWMARYLERAEDTARLLSVNSHLLLDLPRATKLGWSEIIAITGNDELFDEFYPTRDEASVLSFMCGDRRYPGSILSSLASARENLRTTRDVIPREIWEEVNQLYLSVKEQVGSGITPRRRDAFLGRVIRSCQTVNGLIEGTLSYTPVRSFLIVGRQLERADMTPRIIDVRSANLLPRSAEDLKPFETLQWMSVLKSLTGYQMYRQHVRLRIRGPDVLSFLLQDQLFPRSVACCCTESPSRMGCCSNSHRHSSPSRASATARRRRRMRSRPITARNRAPTASPRPLARRRAGTRASRRRRHVGWRAAPTRTAGRRGG